MTSDDMMMLGRKEIVQTDESLFRAQKIVANTIEVWLIQQHLYLLLCSCHWLVTH